VQLTATPAANNISGAWAPDGSRIAFDSDRSGLGPDGFPMVDIFTMKPDVLGEDSNFAGRCDIALGDPALEFGKVCSALDP
jgi:hypothetical protein